MTPIATVGIKDWCRRHHYIDLKIILQNVLGSSKLPLYVVGHPHTNMVLVESVPKTLWDIVGVTCFSLNQTPTHFFGHI